MKTTLITGAAGISDWGMERSADLMASSRLLTIVAADQSLGRLVRIYRPAPTVAFSGLERRLPNFQNAVSEAVAYGFEPVVRPAGGRMVALDQDWIVVDVITPEIYQSVKHVDVYQEFGTTFVRMLQQLGVDAAIGEVPGEYCPGEYSINSRGQVKMVGTAQRVRRGARLFSACIPFSISLSVEFMFQAINSTLNLDWKAQTLVGLNQEAPGSTITDLENALLENFAPQVDSTASLTDVYQAGRKLEAIA